VWHLETGQALRIFEGHTYEVDLGSVVLRTQISQAKGRAVARQLPSLTLLPSCTSTPVGLVRLYEPLTRPLIMLEMLFKRFAYGERGEGVFRFFHQVVSDPPLVFGSSSSTTRRVS
jgi:hypothetical protein